MAVDIRPYSPKELRQLYGRGKHPLSEATWLKWIRPIKEKLGERQGDSYNPKQVRIIFEHLGEPGE